MSGKLYLIPTTLGDENPYQVLPNDLLAIVQSINYFVVENTRSARRFLKKLDKDFDIDSRTFYELNKRTRYEEMVEYIAPAINGENIGVISEAGCPGVADPGAEIVKVAHKKKVTVKPLVGPSSILLSLMGSGMNGQSFAFIGYLPIKQPQRSKQMRFLENLAVRNDQTQIFIETPYRNNQLLDELVKYLDTRTRLCVAVDLTLDTEYIETKTIGEWKKGLPDIHKRPAIFLIGK